jgi:hypothetical protein
MNCPNCGRQNPDNAVMCGACGASLTNPYRPPVLPGSPVYIDNFLMPAIFSAFCCCLPLGIVSIVYAAQVNGLLAGGDVAGATKAAQSAKTWFWIAFGLGIVVQLLWLLVVFGAGLAGIQAPRR